MPSLENISLANLELVKTKVHLFPQIQPALKNNVEALA